MRKIKKIIRIALFAFVLTSLFVLGGCEKGIENISDLSLLEQQSIIKDQQILKELRWMKDNNIVDQDYYDDALKNGAKIIINDESNALYREAYFYGDHIIPREYVQSRMSADQTNKGARHRRAINITTSGPKTVRVHPTVPSEWKTAVN